MRRVLIALCCLIAPLGACSTNPATGARSFTLLSWEQEKALGAQAAAQFTQEYGGEVDNPLANAYIDRIGARLLEGIEEGVPDDLEWEFTLLDSDVINAFALPGGKVFISRGLAQKLEDEAQLAGVIGHEIGHVTARHGNQRISKQLGFNLVLAGAALAVGVADEDSDLRKYGQYAVPALAIGGNIVLLKYGRDEESEADMLGVRYMTRARYDPMGQVDVMRVLKAASGPQTTPEWLSTHPAPDTRIERLRRLIRNEYAYTLNNREYKRYRARYQRQFLSQFRAQHNDPGTADEPALAALNQPHTWCALCDDDPNRLRITP